MGVPESQHVLGETQGRKLLMVAATHRGFTLVELMVALTISLLLLLLALPQYTTWVADGEIRNGAESVVNGLRQTQLAAISQNRNAQFDLAAGGWTASMVGPPLVVIQSATFAEGAQHTTITGLDATLAPATTVAFNALGQIIPGATNLVSIDITNPALASSRPLRVLVGNGRTGVRLCDPSMLVASNPKYCPP